MPENNRQFEQSPAIEQLFMVYYRRAEEEEEGEWLLAVSYTHLDVYKRQDYTYETWGHTSTLSFPKTNSTIVSKYNTDGKLLEIVYSDSPVSYTHLDVYKRQIIDSHPFLRDFKLKFCRPIDTIGGV